jgi:hypothetical protein
MENQIGLNNPSGNLENKPKKRRAKWIIIALIIILVALFLILGGYNNIKTTIKGLWAVSQYNAGIELYEKTMAEDTYGGETPEETLAMFINALEKEDIELASKYFILDDNLSRQKWEDGLKQLIELDKLQEILKFLKSVEKSPRDFIGMNSYELVTWNADKTLIDHVIRFDLNIYSKVWKITSF